jgi:hypothetical protein
MEECEVELLLVDKKRGVRARSLRGFVMGVMVVAVEEIVIFVF